MSDGNGVVGKMCNMSGARAGPRLGTPNLGVRPDCFQAKKSPGWARTYMALNSTLCPMVFYAAVP